MKKTIKKKHIIILASVVLMLSLTVWIVSPLLRPQYTGVDYSPADLQTQADKAIRFNSAGKLKILHVTDTHLNLNHNFDPTIWMVERACEAEKPDIAIITGDIVYNCDNPADTKRMINALMNIFESRGIPVAVTFGNHDSERGAMTREELMAYYNTFSCSVSIDDGAALSGCGTYNVPVLSSDSDKVKFNLWVFDSGDYDAEGRYSCVQPDQVEWYKATSEALKADNDGQVVNSLVFQHIIVGEVYDALLQSDSWAPYAFEHLYNEGEYYMLDPDGVNYGTLREFPCPGYSNHGQFEQMVEQGDVLAMFTGHDHTNAFGVNYKGLDIVNSTSTRYIGLAHSTQCGYRVIEIDENDTTTYHTRVERIYNIFNFDAVKAEFKNGDSFTKRMSLEFAIKGVIQKNASKLYRVASEAATDRQVTYPD